MRSGVPLLVVERHWVCPNCTATQITRRGDVHTPMHDCRGLKGLSAPYNEVGMDAQVVAVERADYLGGENQTRDGEGRPIMSILRKHADGRIDCWAQAPHARMEIRT
jgi:hypothetical protein